MTLQKSLQRTDEELVLQTIKGDLKAFEQLVRKYQYALFARAYRLLNDVHAAQDATQEVFVRAFKHIASFDPTKQVRPWLYAICSNYCKDYIRKNARLRYLPEETEGPNEYETILERLIKEDQHKRLHLALLQLPSTYRLPIEQHYWRNLSYQTIALYNQIPLNTVRTRIRRGKDMLANMLRRK